MKNSRILNIFALVLILALAAYLRLANNTTTPGWYTDEGTHLDIARHLRDGEIHYMAVEESTLLFARLPLFETLLAGALNLKDAGMGTLRTLTGLLGTLAVAMLYWVTQKITGDRLLALLAALLLAIYPDAVLYSRFGFSYNLLTPLVLMTYLGLWQYLNAQEANTEKSRQGLILAAMAIGIGALSDLWMFVLIAPMGLAISARRWRDAFWSLPLTFVPWGIYTLVMLFKTPEAFIFDLGFTFFRLSSPDIITQLTTLGMNYTILISQSHWIALGLVGIFLIKPTRLQYLTLGVFFIPIMVLGRTVALYNLSFYYMIPLLSFAALGMAVLIKKAVPYAYRGLYAALDRLLNHWLRVITGKATTTAKYTVALKSGAYLALALIMLTPFLTSTLWTIRQTQQGFSTILDPFLIKADDAYAVAGFINGQASEDDLVIASPGIAWLFQTRTADFQMAAAYEGLNTPHLPADLPKERFAFDPRYSQANFIVIDNLWRTWAVQNVPGVNEILQELETWPLVFQSGQIEVYRNPI